MARRETQWLISRERDLHVIARNSSLPRSEAFAMNGVTALCNRESVNERS